MWCSFFLLVVLTGCVDPVTGFSNGKVSIACGDMVPQHGHDPSPDPPPYSITVDRLTFSPGDKIIGTMLNSRFTLHCGDTSSPLLAVICLPLIPHQQYPYKWPPLNTRSSRGSWWKLGMLGNLTLQQWGSSSWLTCMSPSCYNVATLRYTLSLLIWPI